MLYWSLQEISQNYAPESRMNKYLTKEFINEGSLIVLEGVIIDTLEVYEDLDNYLQTVGYDVRCFGYDPYNAKEFVERWERENGPFGIEKVIQGARTESVPLGELKKLAEERLLQFDEKIMEFCMGNCITVEDTNGNRKLYKTWSNNRLLKRDKQFDNLELCIEHDYVEKFYVGCKE